MEEKRKSHLSLVPSPKIPKDDLKVGLNRSPIPVGDFVAEGLIVVMPDSCFPEITVGNPARNRWSDPLRKIDHNWYCDRRSPHVRFLNRDESVLLYNLALQFHDKPGLEIGCWRGWSTSHIALAGVELDALDPVLSEGEHLGGIRESLGAAGILGRVRLYAASSPEGVREIARLTRTKWNFFFIDGDQEGEAPTLDAAECMEHAALDAMIVFHSLVSPDVEKGLQLLRRNGWNVLIYQTQQIMGVAWRGNVKPVSHVPDPTIHWTVPPHLAKYPVSGEALEGESYPSSRSAAWYHQENNRLLDESMTLRASLENIQVEVTERDREIQALRSMLAERAVKSKSANDLESKSSIQGDRGKRDILPAEALSLGFNSSGRPAETGLAREFGQIGEEDRHIQRLFFEVEKFTGEMNRLTSALGGVLPNFDSIVGSSLWKMAQPMRRIRASRFAPKINLILVGIAYRILKSVRMGAAIATPLATGLNWQQLVLFDSDYYLEMNPDVAEGNIDPFQHYITSGAAEGRNPHPLFDTSFYYERNPHVRELGINPLLHYINQGAMEGRDPHPLFSVWFYRETNPEVGRFGMDPLVHYLKHGAAEGRNPHPLFDTLFYCAKNPDVMAQGINPLVHFVIRGAAEGRHPHPLFDSTFYREKNPDVMKAGINPLLHYLSEGALEGRDPHPFFDSSFHTENNSEVAQAGINPLWHFAVFGSKEDRDPHPLFDTSFYREQKPQIRDLAINPLVHFLKEGPTAEFDPFSVSPDFPDSGICIVTPDIVGPVKNGGIGTACYHFARVLAKEGHAVSILFSGDLTDCQKAHWRNVYSRYNIKFIALSDTIPVDKQVYGSSWFYENSWRIFDYLRKAHFSVVHFQDWQANGFWSIKAKRVGLAFERTTLTLMTHSCTEWINEGMQQFGAEPLETAKLVWAEAYCMEHCDILISPSRYMIDWLKEKEVRLSKKILLSPYVWFEEPAAEIHTPSRVDNDHLIFFGRLETRKGLHVFCEAIRQLSAQCGPVPRKISFLGKYASVLGQYAGDYLEDFRQEFPTIEICIVDSFDYIQALNYIRTSEGLVVICPIMDNSPLTVIESIQNRLPFLASATGGIPELVSEHVSFEPTVDSLSNRLRTRESIDHNVIRHKYSPSHAESVWRQVNTELTSSAVPGLGESKRSSGATRKFPAVSICIPFFNHHQYLETLVMSIARQTYPMLEVVLVNDGSGPEAAAEFIRVKANNRDPRFKFLATENNGPGAARNHAVESSAGDFLLFFDADNLPKDAEYVSRLVRAIQQSEADCVTVPYDIVGSERVLVRDGDVIATYRPTGACLEAGFFENVLGDATMIISRSVFESIGGFPTRRAAWEDHEFLLQLCFSGFTLETYPDSAFYYRKNPKGRNHSVNAFDNYQSLFGRLQLAKSEDLARIIASVGGPMLLARPAASTRGLIASVMPREIESRP